MAIDDQVPYEVINADPYQYRCAWDDRFALAAFVHREWKRGKFQVAIDFAGESLLSNEHDITVYKTAVLTARMARSQLLDDLKFDMTEAARKELRTMPVDPLPQGWIDRGATASLQSPGTWFQSEKWDLVECKVESRTEWLLMSRPHGEPTGKFATKEEGFAIAATYGADAIPEVFTKVKIVNFMPTREQFEASLQGGSPFIKIEPESKPSDDDFFNESIVDKMFHEQIDFKDEPSESKQETWRDREQLFW